MLVTVHQFVFKILACFAVGLKPHQNSFGAENHAAAQCQDSDPDFWQDFY
jgi:hypothetical protein